MVPSDSLAITRANGANENGGQMRAEQRTIRAAYYAISKYTGKAWWSIGPLAW